MSTARGKAYRRSWKNLLINKGYQLRFTLFMVGISAALMSLLGAWVASEAQKATRVAINNVEGRRCPPAPEGAAQRLEAVATGQALTAAVALGDEAHEGAAASDAPSGNSAGNSDGNGNDEGMEASAAGAEIEAVDPAGTEVAGSGAQSDGADGATDDNVSGDTAGEAGDSAAAGADGLTAEAPRPRVIIERSSVKLEPMAVHGVPPGFADAVVEHYRCRHEQVAKISSLHQGYRNILYVLIGAGILLVLGLAFYGIKMTHRVAGPLHKVSLYFDKMRDGRLDEVYDLRKGDQLVRFYNRFKAAHQGLVGMQREDIEVLRQVVESADVAEIAARSPEIAAALSEMREVLARKESELE